MLDGPHPNAAQVWANWLLPEEGQAELAEGGFSPVLPVPTPYDTEGFEFIRDRSLPQDEFTAFPAAVEHDAGQVGN